MQITVATDYRSDKLQSVATVICRYEFYFFRIFSI